MSKEKVAETKINLFKEFPSTNADEWKKQIEKDLPDVDYAKELVWKTCEGFNVEPFYTEADLEDLSYLTDSVPGQYPFIRGYGRSGNEWEICEEIPAKNIKESNNTAREAFYNGADSLTFSGLPADIAKEMPGLISGIPVDEIKLNFNIDLDTLEIFSLLADEAGKRGIEPSKLSGTFYLSPLNYLISNGSTIFDSDKCFQKIRNFVNEVDSQAPGYKTLAVNSDSFTAAGSNVVQELAFSLAMGCEYIVKLEEAGMGVDLISRNIVFQFSVSSNYFIEIAKLRAARLLWARIVDKFNPADRSSCEMTIHCKTSYRKDPYEKMLSDTVESMAAIIGGCDALTVLPFDSRHISGNEFSQRLTRNTQMVLKEEACMDKITDPGSGSYYIEKLTDLLSGKALKLFQIVEKNGGFIKCVENSFIPDRIAEAGKSGKNPG